MLSDAERKAIDEVVSHSETVQSASIDVLVAVQEHRGWISDETLKDIAEYVKIPAAELDGVATFYNLIYRSPVGKHVIHVCDSISCWVTGCEAMRRTLEKKLDIKTGETTADGKFTLLVAQCLGACDRAPAVIIDEQLYGPVDETNLDEIISRYNSTEGKD